MRPNPTRNRKREMANHKLVKANILKRFELEITIPAFWVGGSLALIALLFILYVALRTLKATLFWLALGSVPLFKIAGGMVERLAGGASAFTVLEDSYPLLLFFLKPLDDLLINPPYEWATLPIAVLLTIWLGMCIGFGQTLALHMTLRKIWGMPIGLAFWWVLTGTAHGTRTLMVSAAPILQPILMSYQGILLPVITALAILPVSYIQYRRAAF